MPAKRVLDIGQCLADHTTITWMIRQHFNAEVVPAATGVEALRQMRERAFDLVLVNRVLDLDGTSGLDLIEQMKADRALEPLPVMLVSNYQEAQNQAEQRGAVKGFGKGALGQPEVVARLQKYLR